jgi:hypothetical protein
MTIQEAKDLHADITRLLLELENLRNSTVKEKTEDNVALTVQINGGTFR